MNTALRLAAVTTVAALAAVLAPAAATAAPIGQCSTTQGTIIAVDFAHWGGPIIRGCGVQANGQPDPDPYTLLHDGGFTVAYVNGEPFVCRIGNAAFDGGTQYPTPADDHCVVTPPASAYWSYWTAAPGASSWHYATMTETPIAGGVSLWTFGATSTNGAQGAPPASLIDQLRAHNATTAETAVTPVSAAAQPKPATMTTQPPRSPVPGPATAAGQATGSPSTSATTSATDGATSAAGTTSAGPTTSRGQARVVPAAASAPHHDSGSALPIVVTAVIVAALGGAAGVTLLRRRRHERG